jgi:hypothetical protein
MLAFQGVMAMKAFPRTALLLKKIVAFFSGPARSGQGNVWPSATSGPPSTLMWPASYNFIILDSYFNIENMLKIQKKF